MERKKRSENINTNWYLYNIGGGLIYGLIRDNSSDPGDPLAIGICAQHSWWLNSYIAGHCCYSNTGPNNPGTQTVGIERNESQLV
jgi:hypothetical protein